MNGYYCLHFFLNNQIKKRSSKILDRECPARGPIPDSSLLVHNSLFMKFAQFLQLSQNLMTDSLLELKKLWLSFVFF
jgi:hypothetical protein